MKQQQSHFMVERQQAMKLCYRVEVWGRGEPLAQGSRLCFWHRWVLGIQNSLLRHYLANTPLWAVGEPCAEVLGKGPVLAASRCTTSAPHVAFPCVSVYLNFSL